MVFNKDKKLYVIYIFLLAAVCISFLFTNVSYDAEYQMSMGYRMIKGDSMILEMWEPNQTSAFLCAVFMKLYMAVTGTTTGIVLFLQAVGLLIRGSISFLMFRAFQRITSKEAAAVAAILFLVIAPKDLLIPEYTNMQLWFAAGMLLFFLEYMEKQHCLFLIGGGISLCLGIFSYPSFAIAYIAALVIIFLYFPNKVRDAVIFTIVCICIGLCYAGWFLYKIDLETIFNCLKCALSLEPSHTVSYAQKVMGFVLDIAEFTAVLGAFFGIGFLIEKGINVLHFCKSGLKDPFSVNRWLLLSGYVVAAFVFLNVLSGTNRTWYGFGLAFLLILGFIKAKLLDGKEKVLYVCAMWIGCMNHLSTLILSDHPFMSSIPYILLSVCASVIPIYKWFEKNLKENRQYKKLFIYGVNLFLMLLIFRGLFLHVSIYGRAQTYSLMSDVALIRSGPAIGIITDEEGAVRQRDSMAEWKEYINPGDTIWLLGHPLDTMGYLYEDVEVGAPTVMSTPTYNENLLYYWELNPHKYPDVVILASSYGELAIELANNEWLMNWIEEEYQAKEVIDGRYWRYYFKESR